MEIDEKTLRELVIKAIEMLKYQSNIPNYILPEKKVYVIFTEKFNEKYLAFFEELNKEKEYEAYAIVPPEMYVDFQLSPLNNFDVCKAIINEKDVNFDELTEYITVFPIVPRNLIVKTALCISDTFETKWIFKSMEKGQRIILLTSGFEKFTGKEPLSYKNKILSYYRTLLEFDIELRKGIFHSKSENIPEVKIDTKPYINQEKIHKNVNYNEGLFNNKSKKVITEREVDNYIYDKKIILNPGDIITHMARDRANSLNIEVIRR